MNISRRQAALWLSILIFGCYIWSVTGSFHFDDSHSVEGNLAIRSIGNLWSFWTDSRTSSFIPENRVYRPLVYTFYSVCWFIGNGNTWPFHLMKIFMHLVVSLGIFTIWRRLWSESGWFPVKNLKIQFPFLRSFVALTPAWAAFLLAAIFAVHPAGSECVDYISATTSLQCAMFYVWAFCQYLVFRDSAALGKPQWKALVLSLFLYFLSVASKEEGITLPAMIGVTELFLLPGAVSQKLRPAIKAMLPYAGLGVLLALWILVMHPESGNESRGWTTWDSYFMTQWRAYLWYMRLWFWPWDLNADSAAIEFSKSITDALVLQAAVGNVLVIAFAWLNRKRFPAMLWGLCWFYITISPASSVVVLAEAINEHRMYLAYVGFIGGVFSVLSFCGENFFAPARRAQRLGWIYALVLVGLVIGTETRNRVWATDENLWMDTVEKNPTSGRALNNLALVYLGRGEYEKSVSYLERCETFWPSYMYCALNKGVSLFSIGKASHTAGKDVDASKQFDAAETAFKRAYLLNPRSVHTNFHLGQFYEEARGDCSKALEYFRTAVEVTGGRYPAAEARIADCLTRMGKNQEASTALDHALEADPENQNVLFEKARIEYESKNFSVAREAYLRILEINSRHVQAWYNLGVLELTQNRLKDARHAFEKTVTLDPQSEQGWYNLAYTTEKLGDDRAALETLRRLTELFPARSELKTRISALEKRSGESR